MMEPKSSLYAKAADLWLSTTIMPCTNEKIVIDRGKRIEWPYRKSNGNLLVKFRMNGPIYHALTYVDRPCN